jgi:hypothetical protein
MSYYFSKITHSTTGVKTRTVGFQPTGARITIGAKDGATQTWIQKSMGLTNGTSHVCLSEWGDTTAGLKSKKDISGVLVSQYDKVAGVWTEVLAAAFDSFTATEFKYNVTTGSADFQFLVECWD